MKVSTSYKTHLAWAAMVFAAWIGVGLFGPDLLPDSFAGRGHSLYRVAFLVINGFLIWIWVRRRRATEYEKEAIGYNNFEDKLSSGSGSERLSGKLIQTGAVIGIIVFGFGHCLPLLVVMILVIVALPMMLIGFCLSLGAGIK